MCASPSFLTLASHTVKKLLWGTVAEKKKTKTKKSFLAGRVNFLQFDIPGDGN